MRRSVLPRSAPRIVGACLAVLLALPVTEARSQNLPPHAWLFGTWTGGLFPVPERMSSQACFSQPVVIFTRDLVMRATLTQQELTQRLVETARATPGGTEFRFAAAAQLSSMFGAAQGVVGFGCATPNELTVQRVSENEISFPGCADFAYPLVRCR